MQQNNQTIPNFLNILDKSISNCQSNFEKEVLYLMSQSSFVLQSKFPRADTYIEYEDSKKEKLKRIILKLYIAGFTKDDINIEILDSENTLIISGNLKNNSKHFPKSDNIEKISSNASAKNFKIKYGMGKFEFYEANLNDGVLDIIIKPNKDKNLRRIDIT